MTKRYTMKDGEGNSFEMGAGISEVGRGDAIKVGEKLKRISSISSCGKWNKTITTESGKSYGMTQIQSYGRRE